MNPEITVKKHKLVSERQILKYTSFFSYVNLTLKLYRKNIYSVDGGAKAKPAKITRILLWRTDPKLSSKLSNELH